MDLKSESMPKIRSASLTDFHNYFNSLNTKNNSFLILSKSKVTYMQVALHEEDSFYLSYQTSNRKNHFIAKNRLRKTEVLEILTSYYSNKPFKSLTDWKKEDFSTSKQEKIASWLFFSAIITGLILYFFQDEILNNYFYDFFQEKPYLVIYVIPMYMTLPSFYLDLKNRNSKDPRNGPDSKVRAIGMFILSFLLTLSVLFPLEK